MGIVKMDLEDALRLRKAYCPGIGVEEYSRMLEGGATYQLDKQAERVRQEAEREAERYQLWLAANAAPEAEGQYPHFDTRQVCKADLALPEVEGSSKRPDLTWTPRGRTVWYIESARGTQVVKAPARREGSLRVMGLSRLHEDGGASFPRGYAPMSRDAAVKYRAAAKRDRRERDSWVK